jgi:hypothetical protein
VQIGLLGLAVLGLSPLGYVGCLVFVQAGLCVVLLVRLGRPSLGIRARPVFVRRILWTVVLMGSPDVCLYLCTSVLVVVLSASAFRYQVGPLVAVEIVWSAGVNFLLYALRVYAPHTSVRLLGAAGAGGRRAARRIALWVTVGDLVYLAVLAALLGTTDLLAVSRSGNALLVWVALFAGRLPMLVAVIAAGYLVENSDAPATRVTGGAAAASLAAAAASGLVLVPLFGGVGMLAALGFAEAVQAAAIWGRLTRRTGTVRPLVEEDLRAAA